jgi:cyclic beta-1,2-glucan synthetase
MEYFYLLLALIILAFILILMIDKRKKIENLQMRTLSDEDFFSGIRAKARQLRTLSNAKGVNIYALSRKINKAIKSISQKNNNNRPLFEYERWLYENYYLVRRFMADHNNRNFNRLPGSDQKIRILEFARYIVANSSEALTQDRIVSAIKMINNETSLLLSEVMSLKKAITYALIEQIYILSERIIHHNKMQRLANRRYFKAEYLSSDVYAHYALKNPRFSGEAHSELLKMGVESKSIDYNYSLSTLESTKMAKSLFKSLMHINSLFNEDVLINHLNISKVLNKDDQYANMSLETKKSYLNIIERLSFRLNVSELLTANKVMELARHNDIFFGDVLACHAGRLAAFIKTNQIVKLKAVSRCRAERAYILALNLIAFIASALAGWYYRSVLVGVLSLVPFFFIIEKLLNSVLISAVRPAHIPSMNYTAIPNECNTLIVISQFIADKGQLEDAIHHLRSVKESNNDKNIQASLLIDFKSSKQETDADDSALIEALKQFEGEEGYNIFVRKRCKVGDKYCGWERKRGAIMALNRYLVNGDTKDFYYISNRNAPSPKFVIALDDDNVILPGTAKELVNLISHPSNSRYDLISVRSKYNLYSVKTPYSKRFLAESGVEAYPNYSSLYFNLFKKDIFCGKGIYRLKEFYNKLEGIFPSNKILSHDIIEGAILSTASTSFIYENAPKNFVSEKERRTRWTRGDIELLPFVLTKWKNDDNNIYKSEISPFYKFIIIKNVISIINPACILAILILFFIHPSLWILALIVATSSMVIDWLINLRRIKDNIRFRYIFAGIVSSAYLTVEYLMLLPFEAFHGIRTLAATVIKMIKKGNLLEWKTYYSSQKASGFNKFAALTAPSMILMPVIVAAFALAGINILPIGIFALLAYLWLPLVYMLGLQPKEKPLKEKDKKLLRNYALKTYNYFTFMNNNMDLIADNFQLKPYKGASETTSPTNIGYGLLAEICAYYLELNSLENILANIEKTVHKIERLHKWKGNLYNWYYTKTGEVAQKFVSSVDSGNLIACLIIAAEFLREHNQPLLAKRAQLIIENTDLRSLFDERANLFYLGYNATENRYEGAYDLLASESRLLSLVYMAYGGPVTHYRELTRDYTPIGGNTLYSWSGTAFEYLMPSIFLKPPDFSLLSRTCANAVKAQKKVRRKNMWGMSESGYYKFDEHLKYQYRAFGINELALDIDKNHIVISPYSSFLSLYIKPASVIKNLKKLQKNGVYGEYGFYESLDFTSKKQIIFSYMTHHQGMIIASLANFLAGGAIEKLMLRNAKIEGVKILLSERTSEKVYRRKQKDKKIQAQRDSAKFSDTYCELKDRVYSGGLSNGTVTGFYDSNGNSFVKYQDILINKFRGDYKSVYGGMFYIKHNNRLFSPTYYPLRQDKANHTFTANSDSVNYANTKEKVTLDIAVDDDFNAEVRRLTFNSDNNNPTVYFFEELAISRQDEHESHQTFCNMFISTEIDKQRNIVFVRRKARRKKGDIYAAYIIRGLKDLEIETNRFNYIGRNKDERTPDFILNKNIKFNSEGDVLEPCVGFSGKFIKRGNSGYRCEIIKIVDENMDNLLNLIELLPSDFYEYALEKSTQFILHRQAGALAAPFLYKPYSQETLAFVCENDLHKEFAEITDYKKTLFFRLQSIEDTPLLLSLCSIINSLRLFGIRTRLLIVYEDTGDDKNKAHIEEQLKRNFISDYKLINAAEENSFIKEFAFISLNESLAFGEFSFPDNTGVQEGIPPAYQFDLKENMLLESGNGGFDTEGNYLVDNTRLPELPYSNIVAGKQGGFVITENGGGFAFFGNSRENKVIRFENDPIKDYAYEQLHLCSDVNYRLNRSGPNCRVTHGMGITLFSSRFDELSIDCEFYIIEEGSIRIAEVSANQKNMDNLCFAYFLDCALGWRHEPTFIYRQFENGILKAKNLYNSQAVFIKAIGKNISVSSNENLDLSNLYISIDRPLSQNKFYIAMSDSADALATLCEEKIEYKKEEVRQYYKNLSNIELISKITSANLLINNYLLYQVISSRMNAKSGYYQIGGATGFRDQLQDALALIHSAPQRCREQILYHAAHQYSEGDVMHWWHHEKFGVRTRISDDKLFLPYAVAVYTEATQDYSILQEKVPYLSSPVLEPNEQDRFENPPYTAESFTLHEHCLQAIRHSLKFGEHNLLQMGSGDWNDGMDYIGEKGKGESVLLTMFAYETIMKFKELCKDSTRIELVNIAAKLQKAIEAHAFEGEHYMRAYSDSGKWYGTMKSDEFKIDLAVQSYAQLSGIASEERAKSAIDAAGMYLVDREGGVIKLLDPPLNKQHYIGYISSYPEGVRENGGQYTHAAIWYLIALARLNRQNEAFELFQMINPIEKNRNPFWANKYLGEPYVLSGDVYAGKDNKGRMGWSWYTGSAAWAYRLLTEEFLGLKRRGEELIVDPLLPDALADCEVIYRYKDAKYTIKYRKTNNYKLYFDGIEIAKGKAIPLHADKGAEIVCEC